MKKNIYFYYVLLFECLFMLGIVYLLTGVFNNVMWLIIIGLINIILNVYNAMSFTYFLECEDLKGGK